VTPRERVAGIVLAAGDSSRMGPERNKLVERIAGRPLVAGPVDALIEAGIEPVFVVVGFEAERVRAALAGRSCRFVENADWQAGMGSSLACAMRELIGGSPLPDAVLVCVGDLPGLRASDVVRVVEAARREARDGGGIDPDRIVLPVFAGRRGHPVCFGARHFAALARSSGDEGGRALLEQNTDAVLRVELGNETILHDVDTPTDLAAARQRADRD